MSVEIAVSRVPVFNDAQDDLSYWQANPDIAACGMTASDHYAQFGRQEGRMQAANQQTIAEIREKKLRKVLFRQQPVSPRQWGEPANFITPEIKKEFHIPDFPPISAHDYGTFISDIQKDHPDWMFLDVGAGLRSHVNEHVVNVDIFNALSTDVICVGEDLPFADNQFDYVICGATLEHTRRPWEVAAEICRVLKPGGVARIDYPFLQPEHGYPSHYFNATMEGNKSLFEQWCDIRHAEVGPHMHPIHSLVWFLQIWSHGLPEETRKEFANKKIADLLDANVGDWLKSDICTQLSADTQRVICAGSTIEAVKKDGFSFFGSEKEEQYRNQAQVYKKAFETVKASTSWKITAPLRRAVEFLKKGARSG
ncbi:class I SAM-dependent methyltransferase [Acetobacter sp.]|uniref:class I SAM-dependent methyltransferase n=1 Tax=Acetobacter sp. TaxID=440 RepID=UPI0039EC5344